MYIYINKKKGIKENYFLDIKPLLNKNTMDPTNNQGLVQFKTNLE